jgi:hypothetical protein
VVSHGQEWLENLYHETTLQDIDKNYKQLWLDTSFQGVIGNRNQRIEMRFVSVVKDLTNPYKYHIAGKSKVNRNICDFNCELFIDSIKTLKDSTAYGEAPEISKGMLLGSYFFKEDSTQSHVGKFQGHFYVKFDEFEEGKTKVFSELYYDDENLVFIGSWQEYNKGERKDCNWGLLIPPGAKGTLFTYYENGYYLINPQYLDQGWESYALANNWILIPLVFQTNSPRFEKDFKSYNNPLIQQSKEIEERIWWK